MTISYVYLDGVARAEWSWQSGCDSESQGLNPGTSSQPLTPGYQKHKLFSALVCL